MNLPLATRALARSAMVLGHVMTSNFELIGAGHGDASIERKLPERNGGIVNALRAFVH
jgi:hypothetical protein